MTNEHCLVHSNSSSDHYMCTHSYEHTRMHARTYVATDKHAIPWLCFLFYIIWSLIYWGQYELSDQSAFTKLFLDSICLSRSIRGHVHKSLIGRTVRPLDFLFDWLVFHMLIPASVAGNVYVYEIFVHWMHHYHPVRRSVFRFASRAVTYVARNNHFLTTWSVICSTRLLYSSLYVSCFACRTGSNGPSTGGFSDLCRASLMLRTICVHVT